MYGAMFWPSSIGLSDALAWQVTPDQWWCVLIGIVLVYLPLFGTRLPWQRPVEAMGGFWRLCWFWAPTAGFILGMILLYSRAAVPFLYFQF
jgi:alginate O-acetyltransferase complex protein AlgI